MVVKNNNRIGIFEYNCSLYLLIKDFVIKLTEAGYSVDFFYKDWGSGINYTDINDFNRNKKIRFFDFTKQVTRRQVFKRRYIRLLNKIAIFFSFPRNYRPEEIIDREIFNKSREIINGSQYLCFIGIEKRGLIWAGLLSEIFKCPFIYYNLELYIEDNPEYYRVYHLRNAERRYHQLSNATIIQDVYRANALLKSNGVGNTNLLYYPVSVKGNIIQGKSKYLQKKFNIGDDKKIILYFGSIHKTRCVAQIVRIAQNLDDDVILVVHGWGPKKYLDYLQSIAEKKKVIFSLDFLAEDEIVSMVSSAHIGIALYETTNVNDKLVTFSSSKMAYYAKCGVPIIVFDTENFRDLMNIYLCGEMIKSIGEVPRKVRKILGNYNNYQDQAYKAYMQFYNLDKNFSKFLSEFKRTLEL